MTGPVCKVYFNSESERDNVEVIAVRHGMTLKQFMHATTIDYCNKFIAQLEAANTNQEISNEVDNTGEADLSSEENSGTDSETTPAES